MGWLDGFTGKEALAKVEQTTSEIQEAHAALATRMIEVLEVAHTLRRSLNETRAREERLDERLQQLDVLCRDLRRTRWMALAALAASMIALVAAAIR